MIRYLQGSKNVLSGHPEQVDFPGWQVTSLALGQGLWQVICQLSLKKSKLRLVQGNQYLRAACLNEIQLFLAHLLHCIIYYVCYPRVT